MKKQFIKSSLQLFLTLNFFLLTFNSFSQGTAINTTGAAADPSAMLDVSSSNKGFLTPRMSEAERMAIQGPARGLLVYQIDNDYGFWFFDGINWLQANAGDNLGNHTAADSLDMANQKIVNLATCTQNLDAANKEYVDNAVAAGGGGSTKPSMISVESSNLTYSDAVQYCENLNEGGFNDWKLPEAGEIQFFAGMSGASSNFLWTKSLTDGQDFATNQNFITVRLTDGKWRNGGVNRFYFPTRNFYNSTTSTTWTTVISIEPIFPGNLFVITSMYYKISNNSSGNTGTYRLKYTFPDGTFMYSEEKTITYTYTDVVNISSIPILNEMAAFAKIEAEARSDAGTNNKTVTLNVSGYEIYLNQKDGQTLPCRCVR